MPSDAAFREALDAYISLVQWLRAWALNRDNTRPSEEEINAARARVLALYAEAQRQGERDQLALAEQVAEATIRMEQGRAERQGEVYYVGAWRLDGSDRDLPAVALDAPFKPGDKVRVTKVEEAK